MTPYGFVYVTTNLVNGKKYLGQARYRKNLSKNYLGSGNEIQKAITKYGRKVFTRDVVFEAFTFDDLNWAETFFIAEADAVKSRQWYNISPGGRASLGFTGKKHHPERNKALSKKMLANHPRAKKIEIGGVSYHGVQAAADSLRTTRGKIEEFLKSGIHPQDQGHKLNGYKRGTQRSSRTTWILMNAHGHSEQVIGLDRWCAQNNVPYAIRDHQGSLYHGWILTRPSSQPSPR